MSAHTPGPWRVGFEDGTGGVDDDGGAWIIGADEEIVVAGGSHEGLKYGVTDEANARLISVTPELLAAAQRALAFFELLAEKTQSEGEAAELEPDALLLRDAIRRAQGEC